jgi:superfamily II DNA or RNA helicase
MVALRDYQKRAIERLRQKIREGKRRLVLVMPTGGGKTIVAAAMIHASLQRNAKSLFFAHRRELVDQCVDKLHSFGVQCGVIMAGDRRRDDYLATQVASVQTLVRRLDRKPPADVVYVDECHHATSETYQRVLDAYPSAIVIGLTATPWRADRIGLSDIYDDYVLACTPAELMRQGSLVYYDAFAYDAPELHDVRTTAGDFNQADLGVACNTRVLVASIVSEYMKHAKGRRAIVFPVNVEHSLHLVEEFRLVGMTAEHVDHTTPAEQRKTTMQRFRTGDLTILSSVGVLTEGFDAPAAEVCILARPTKSLTLFIQMVGRVLRPCPETGKQRALIHDHAGNTIRHGFIEEERDYSLLATPDTVRALHTCPACHKIFSTTKQGHCPHCGELIGIIEDRNESGERKKHIFVDGQRISREQIEKIRGKRGQAQLLLELTDEDIARAALASRQDKAAEYLRLREVQQRKGLAEGFIAHQFRAVFSHWPRFTDEELTGVTPATKPFFPLRRRSA